MCCGLLYKGVKIITPLSGLYPRGYKDKILVTIGQFVTRKAAIFKANDIFHCNPALYFVQNLKIQFHVYGRD